MQRVRAALVCLVAWLALPGRMQTPGPAVPLGTAVSPGDTVLVGERWF